MLATSSPVPLPSPPSTDSDSSSSLKSSVDKLASLIKTVYRTSDLNFFVNGRPVTVKNPNPDWVLLDWIRLQDGLKGTKLGCGEGGCGACTVVIQTAEQGRRVSHLAVNACLYPLIGVDGKSLITIEGLGTANRPHPLQERIAKMQYVPHLIPLSLIRVAAEEKCVIAKQDWALMFIVARNVVSAHLVSL